MLGSMSKWLYDESPTEALKFEAPLAQLKGKIAESGSKVFQEMTKQYLADNMHRSTVEMAPSKTLEEELLKEEQERLAAIKKSLSEDELQGIIDNTLKLKELQAAEDSPEARATIPSLELSDLKREEAEYPIAVSEDENGSGVTVIRHELGSTSGIAYVNFGIDLSAVPLDDVPLLPLFGRMLKETGAGEYDPVALSQRIGTNTGGINVGLFTTAVHPEGGQNSVGKGEQMCTKLYFKGKATSEKTDELLSIMKLMLTDARLDSQTRVVEMLRESRSRLESMIQSSGHSAISNRMKARYRVAGYIDEITGGITYLGTVKELLKQAEEDWPTLLGRLENIRKALLENPSVRSGMFLDITGDAKVLESVQPALKTFLDELPGEANGPKMFNYRKEVHPWVPEARERMAEMVPIKDEGFVVPTQVSYVGKSGLLFDEGETVPGSAEVVSRFLRTGYLWDYVRVMGGAYGGFCQFSGFSGFFAFLSYRDPNLDKTIDVYDGAADALLAAAEALENDPDALATAIIGTIGDRDGALSPDQKGFTSLQRWLGNESHEYRQRKRDEILNTKASDFRAFAERLKRIKNPSVAVVSSKAAFEAAAKAGKTMELKDVF
jgi:presequence protease